MSSLLIHHLVNKSALHSGWHTAQFSSLCNVNCGAIVDSKWTEWKTRYAESWKKRAQLLMFCFSAWKIQSKIVHGICFIYDTVVFFLLSEGNSLARSRDGTFQGRARLRWRWHLLIPFDESIIYRSIDLEVLSYSCKLLQDVADNHGKEKMEDVEHRLIRFGETFSSQNFPLFWARRHGKKAGRPAGKSVAWELTNKERLLEGTINSSHLLKQTSSKSFQLIYLAILVCFDPKALF